MQRNTAGKRLPHNRNMLRAQITTENGRARCSLCEASGVLGGIKGLGFPNRSRPKQKPLHGVLVHEKGCGVGEELNTDGSLRQPQIRR